MSIRSQFPRAMQGGYLDTAAEGLPAPGVQEAVSEYLQQKSSGTPGRMRHFEKEHTARETAARLLGTSFENIAFLPTASDALNILAASLPWKPGDRVVTTDLEFPSNVLPWLALRARGVEVHVVRSHAGALRLDDVTAALDARTQLVTISQVSYKTGASFPHIPELAAAAHSVGAALCVDATQALGRCPVRVDGVDYLMASTFKWLLGLHGSAVTYMSPAFRERFSLAGVGWYSVTNAMSSNRFAEYDLKPDAACLVAGMPNFATLYAINASLKYLMGVDNAVEQNRVNALCRALRQRLTDIGLTLLTPAEPEYQSGIVAFEHADGAGVMNRLAEDGVVVWGGDGRVRASLHYYNDESDVEQLMSALPRALTP